MDYFRAHLPGVYTNIAMYIDWIADTLYWDLWPEKQDRIREKDLPVHQAIRNYE